MNAKKILMLLIGVALVVWGVYFLTKNEAVAPLDEGGMVVCTADAMMCPDGTYVGRTGPNCEFRCPAN